MVIVIQCIMVITTIEYELIKYKRKVISVYVCSHLIKPYFFLFRLSRDFIIFFFTYNYPLNILLSFFDCRSRAGFFLYVDELTDV
jgi:hypothetical protein